MVDWLEPYVGLTYRSSEVEVSPSYQLDKLGACGIDAGLFGDCVDPTFFIGFAIHAGIASGISAQGNINMLQQLIQYRPVELGEHLTVQGEIVDIRPVARGHTLHTEVGFYAADQMLVVTANRVSLKPDPAKLGERGAGERPPPIIESPSSLTVLSEHQLTPEGVKAYSTEGNSIHYELDAAQAAGFRAPLIGGGHGVHFLMAELWRNQLIEAFHMDVYFRRPIFWDEQVKVVADTDQGTMALLKSDGKVGTEAVLSPLD